MKNNLFLDQLDQVRERKHDYKGLIWLLYLDKHKTQGKIITTGISISMTVISIGFAIALANTSITKLLEYVK